MDENPAPTVDLATRTLVGKTQSRQSLYNPIPLRIVAANTVYPLLFGWHGSQLCESHWLLQPGVRSLATHVWLQRNGVFSAAAYPHSRPLVPPIAPKTSITGCGMLFAALIRGDNLN